MKLSISRVVFLTGTFVLILFLGFGTSAMDPGPSDEESGMGQEELVIPELRGSEGLPGEMITLVSYGTKEEAFNDCFSTSLTASQALLSPTAIDIDEKGYIYIHDNKFKNKDCIYRMETSNEYIMGGRPITNLVFSPYLDTSRFLKHTNGKYYGFGKYWDMPIPGGNTICLLEGDTIQSEYLLKIFGETRNQYMSSDCKSTSFNYKEGHSMSFRNFDEDYLVNSPILNLAIDPSNNIYFPYKNLIFKTVPTAMEGGGDYFEMLVIAGKNSSFGVSGQVGYAGDGAQAQDALLNNPSAIAFNPKDNSVYFSDQNGRVIRKIDSNGIINTIAGSLSPWAKVENGIPANQFSFGSIKDIEFDQEGTLYIVDGGPNPRILRMVNGLIFYLGGTGVPGYDYTILEATKTPIKEPTDMAISPNGDVYFIDSGNKKIRRINKPNTIAIKSSEEPTTIIESDSFQQKIQQDSDQPTFNEPTLELVPMEELEER